MNWQDSWQNDLKTDSILSLPVRFDRGEIRRAQITPEGYLHSDAIYRRDGVLTYRTPAGIRKELSAPEANADAAKDFGFKPFTIEHPPILLDARNARRYAQGITDSTTYYDPKAGFIRGVVCVFDSEAIATVQAKKAFEISAGYQCHTREEPGVWRGERYDAIQEIIKPNHVAGTMRGRAGPDVSFRGLFDSLAHERYDVGYEDADAFPEQYFVFPKSNPRKDSKKPMASITRNGITFEDVPQDLAVFVTQEFNKLDSLLEERDEYIPRLEDGARTDSQTIQELQAELAEKQEEATYQMGRADDYEVQVTNADSILSDLGYRKDSTGDYYRADMSGKGKGKGKKEMPWEEPYGEKEEDEEEELTGVEAEAEDEGLPFTTKKKKKMSKAHKDSATGVKAKKAVILEEDDEDWEEEDDEDAEVMEVAVNKKKHKSKTHKDSVGEVLTAWKEAEKVVPGLMDSDRFDADLDVEGINELRIAAMKEAIIQAQPNHNLENKADSYIEGVYTGLGLSIKSQPQHIDRTDDFAALLGAAARNTASPLETARQEAVVSAAERWRSPLSLTNRNK